MKTFKILAIDGGGIKGLYSARILQHFEQSLQNQHNDPELRLVDFFDLLCGTSTGGLIALGISLRIPMSRICDIYQIHGPDIFPNPDSFYRKIIRQTLYRGKFSNKYLKKVLIDFFGDHTLADSQSLLCIPSYDFTHGTYALFRYDHKEGNLSRHNKLKYVDVALSTSAAPTYFPLAQIKEENNTQYLDGGVWANNPSLVGFTEAMRYFVGEGKAYDSVQLLSVASLNVSTGKPPMLRKERSFIDWSSDLFDLSLIGQSAFCDVFLNTMVKNTYLPLEYIRIPSAEISAQQVKYIGLDNASEKSLNLMKQMGDHMYHRFKNEPLIEKILGTRKSYYIK
jgi:uncharacterized protein